jgi:hypothetical protein
MISIQVESRVTVPFFGRRALRSLGRARHPELRTWRGTCSNSETPVDTNNPEASWTFLMEALNVRSIFLSPFISNSGREARS